MSNINRDYLIILDVKSGEVDSPNIYYFNTDKNTSNLYVQMVIKETSIEASPVDNATNYSIKANILKPNMVGKEVEGTLVNPGKAIYEFKLPADCTDFSGNAKIEFEVFCRANGVEEIATSFSTKFKVHGSVLTEQNKYIEDSSDYPILKELMAEVVEINKTANELDTTIRTLQADMIDANNEMKTNEATRQANETTRVANEEARITAERTRSNQEVAREEAEAIREGQEATRVANENERKASENQRKANEEVRVANEVERKASEASRVSAENARANAEEVRQTNEANRETAEEIRRTNEQARITAENARVAEHEQMRTELNEVKAENAILMENDKKQADRMTQVEISDKRQYVIMEGLMNSAGDGYLKIEDTGNDTTLYNSVEGFVDVKNITGNTMVNSIKNPDDEFTLNGDINTSGQSVTLTTAVDNGQVDVLAEGNTMVNVCDQRDPVAITKSYTVETGNHVALQGEFDGKARPVPTGNTLVNLIDAFYITIGVDSFDASYKGFTFTKTQSDTISYFRYKLKHPLDKTKKYTIIYDIVENTLVNTNSYYGIYADGVYGAMDSTTTTGGSADGKLGRIISVHDVKSNDEYLDHLSIGIHGGDAGGKLVIDNLMLLEGDYANKPIPDYFTGMKSSFEDKVVTQEMVDSGEELAENLGKYRVDYKVTGKNKLNIDNIMYNKTIGYGSIIDSSSVALTEFIPCQPNTAYTSNFGSNIHYWDKDKKYICYQANGLNSPNNARYMMKAIENYSTVNLNSLQLEEGSTATAYEPYKESIKTYYLNSPLLEGDTIEDYGNDVVHVHRYNSIIFDGSTDEYWVEYTANSTSRINTVAFCIRLYNFAHSWASTGEIVCDKFCELSDNDLYSGDIEGTNSDGNDNGRFILAINKSRLTTQDVEGFKQWLQQNPVTVVYKLASPTYELISQSDTILTDSYVAGHLDFDTAVPIEKVVFNRINNIKLAYQYPNTKYILQFESDSEGKLDELFSSGLICEPTIISKGINKFTWTTGDAVYNTLDITGIGFNMSNIVVTEATDKDFGYFSGMKSVGELEENKIEILSRNKNLLSEDYRDYNNTILDGYRGFKVQLNPNKNYTLRLKLKEDAVLPNGVWITLSSRCNPNVPGAKLRHIILNSKLQYKVDNYTLVFNAIKDYALNYDGSLWICVFTATGIGEEKYTEIINCIEYIQLEEGNTATAYVPHAENKKQILLNEPLRAVGDTKDRFVQIDGKWYVERNTKQFTINGSESGWGGGASEGDTTNSYGIWTNFFANELNIRGEVRPICDKLSSYNSATNVDGMSNFVLTYRTGLIVINIKGATSKNDVLNWLSANPLTIIAQLTSPTYEPVEILPVLNTYSEVTHITNNSTIPMNMPIVNSGYELIAKPSTKYTVVGIDNGRIGDSTIVNGTITTPATIDDPFLRPYGTGTTSKVMLLEGEPANIPGYFKGIKSVFEDKVTEDGKYAVEVKVIGKNKFDINNMSFTKGYYLDIDGEPVSIQGEVYISDYINIKSIAGGNIWVSTTDKYDLTIAIYDRNKRFLTRIKSGSYANNISCPNNGYYLRFNCSGLPTKCLVCEDGDRTYEPYHETKQTLCLDEPLYNANNITIYNDKLGYWKNWDKVVLDGSESEVWNKFGTDAFNNITRYSIKLGGEKVDANILADKLTRKDYRLDEEFIYVGGSNFAILGISKVKVPTQNTILLRQYLSQNPVTVVYELAEPVFVPLIDNCPNWVIGSWDNCSIHFDSIIPLKDTRYRYTGNVPSVVAMSEDVATNSAVSDEQDNLIVDLATQVAVMEMMLM